MHHTPCVEELIDSVFIGVVTVVEFHSVTGEIHLLFQLPYHEILQLWSHYLIQLLILFFQFTHSFSKWINRNSCSHPSYNSPFDNHEWSSQSHFNFEHSLSNQPLPRYWIRQQNWKITSIETLQNFNISQSGPVFSYDFAEKSGRHSWRRQEKGRQVRIFKHF